MLKSLNAWRANDRCSIQFIDGSIVVGGHGHIDSGGAGQGCPRTGVTEVIDCHRQDVRRQRHRVTVVVIRVRRIGQPVECCIDIRDCPTEHQRSVRAVAVGCSFTIRREHRVDAVLITLLNDGDADAGRRSARQSIR